MSVTQKNLIDYCNSLDGQCSIECRYDNAECEAFAAKYGTTPYISNELRPELYTDEVIEAVEAVETAEKEDTPAHPTACSTDDTISRQADLITKMQNGIKATDADDAYSCGMRNGMRWCISLIDDKEPLYENCPPAQSKWIPVNEMLPDVGQSVLLSTTRGHVLAGYRLEPSSLYLVTNDEDGKEMWVYDPDSYTDTYGDAVNDLPRSEDCGFSDASDSYSFLAVTSPNYDARFQGIAAWMPMPKPYKEAEKHGTD